MDEPVLLTADSSDDGFMEDHVTHFFNTRCYESSKSLTKEEREKYYKLWTENEDLIIKLYGKPLLNSPFFLPVALRNGVDNELVQEYKEWLEKQ